MAKQFPDGPCEVKMYSTEYGIEVFKYDNFKEANDGVKRLKAAIAKLNDGVTREIKLVTPKATIVCTDGG